MAIARRMGALVGGATMWLILGLVLGACSVAPEDEVVWGDLSAPSVIAERMDEQGLLELEFDEDVELDEESLRASGGATPEVLIDKGRILSLDTKPGTVAGKAYALAMSAEDKAGNTTSMVIPYYGDNPRLSRVLINELACKSSSTIRDAIELQVLSDGNLAGLTVYIGNPDDNDGFVTFADIEVKSGDFIVVHCKAEGLAGEVDESSDWSASAGKNALPGVLDIWMPGAPGLGDTSGVVLVCDKPLGSVMDAVFYSDKKTESGKEYESFGTKKLLERVRYLHERKAWFGAGNKIAVEDAASSVGLTSTRTLCRLNLTDNSDRRDWAVVASSRASLGKVNSNELYQAP